MLFLIGYVSFISSRSLSLLLFLSKFFFADWSNSSEKNVGGHYGLGLS
jgi:hypothetical protein